MFHPKDLQRLTLDSENNGNGNKLNWFGDQLKIGMAGSGKRKIINAIRIVASSSFCVFCQLLGAGHELHFKKNLESSPLEETLF